MQLAVPFVALCIFAPGSHRGKSPVSDRNAKFARRQSYFYHLAPGTTRRDVISALGKPDEIAGSEDLYRLKKGYICLYYDRGEIEHCYHNKPGDAECRYLYIRCGKERPGDTIHHERLLERMSFGSLDAWGKGYIWTEAYPTAQAFRLRDGFVVLDTWPPLPAHGTLPELVAKATVLRRGREKLVFRAFDHWPSFRPKGMTDAELDRREEVVRRHGKTIVGAKLSDTLGPEDGRFGSGIDYRQYYLRVGIIVITVYGNDAPRIGSVDLKQPGALRPLTLNQWLAKQQK